MDDPASRDDVAFRRLSEVHRQAAGEHHEGFFLLSVNMAAAASMRVVAPDIPACVLEVGELLKLGDMARRLLRLVRARGPLELLGADDPECHVTNPNPRSSSFDVDGTETRVLVEQTTPWTHNASDDRPADSTQTSYGPSTKRSASCSASSDHICPAGATTGDPGVEPDAAVLETTVLPIHQSPTEPTSLIAPPFSPHGAGEPGLGAPAPGESVGRPARND